MRFARLSLIAVVAFVSSACAPKVKPPDPASAPPIRSLMHGLWTGTALKSPLGKQPYAMEFRTEGGEIVGETPPALGEDVLPPGAYQHFRFGRGSGGERVVYKTAMGEKGLLDGELTLDATRSNATRLIYCEPNNCKSMELHWIAVAADRMTFQVWMDGRLHADMALEFDGDL